ncbi:hypothetical protein [Corallococcus sicarius]|nr:hypothetical protein [Corallococcus sicarius]
MLSIASRFFPETWTFVPCASALIGREGVMPPGVRVLLRVACFFIP